MRDAKNPGTTSQQNQAERSADERRSEATSNETLRDLEKSEKVGAEDNEREEIPAPDAEPAEPRENRDDAGPM
jgi:hypothetical protein